MAHLGCSPTVKQNSNSGRWYIECLYRKSKTHVKMSLNNLRSRGGSTTLPPYGAAPFEPRDFGTQAAALAAVPRFIEWIVDGFANGALAAAPPPRWTLDALSSGGVCRRVLL